MTRAQRLAVRIPIMGWEANITSEYSDHTRAKVANVSTGGAYLLGEAEYEPGSIVTLWLRSSQRSFFVTAKILRNDSYGVAVRFLDLCESGKSAILQIISQLQAKRKTESSVEVKTSVCTESHVQLGFDV